VKRASKRSERQAGTRELILDALVDQLGDTGPFAYSVFELARRANVSVRTIYRHFPDRQALLDALAERVERRVAAPRPAPRPLAELSALPAELFRRFEAEEALVRAALSSRPAAAASDDAVEHLRRTLDEAVPELDPATRARAHAVLASMLSSSVWWRLKSELGLPGEEPGRAIGWAVRVLVDALVDENRRAGPVMAPTPRGGASDTAGPEARRASPTGTP
jgi:AcrR family transcriptional regulator